MTLQAPIALGPKPYQFGWAVLAADVRDCHAGASVGTYDGCGHEILVSAPDTSTHTTAGRVYWWKPNGDGNGAYQYVGLVPSPAGLPIGAEFGYALAAPEMLPNPAAPWDASGAAVPWVAIAAPAADKVYIYRVNWASGAPLTLAQTLTAPLSGRRFGHAMAVGDFDGNGLPDLAVAMPEGAGADLEGRVFVYAGRTGALPLQASSLMLNGYALSGTATGGVDADAFGWSLAAGAFIGSHPADSAEDPTPADGLVIGAPMSGPDDDGGFCQAALVGTSTVPWLATSYQLCAQNEFLSADPIATEEHYGWSVAVGNFVNTDCNGQEDTFEARIPEVAVGRPGYASDQGAVAVLLTNSNGARPLDLATEVREYTGPYAGSRFGESMSPGYVQERHREDLAIGAPSHSAGPTFDGTSSLTKASDTSPCIDINGSWEAIDAWGLHRSMRVWNQVGGTSPSVHVALDEVFVLRLYGDYGGVDERLCTQTFKDDDDVTVTQDAEYFLALGTELVLPGAWICGATSQTWIDIDAAPLLAAFGIGTGGLVIQMDVTMTLTTANTMEIDLVLGDTMMTVGLNFAGVDAPADCRPEPLPIELTLNTLGVCE